MNKHQWHEEGTGLQEELRSYDWHYRLKICSKCSTEQQKLRRCFKVNSFRTIKGMRIQETHCNWMTKARSRKFRSKILSYIRMGFRTNSQEGSLE